MSLSDCPKCWDTPCTCGYEYKSWSTERIKELRDILNKILLERSDNSSLAVSQPKVATPKLLDKMEKFAVECEEAGNIEDSLEIQEWVKQLR